MKLVTRQNKANTAAQRWKTHYYDDNKKAWRYSDSKKQIYNNLIKLGNTPNPNNVDRVIGNTSWTYIHCEECDSWYIEKAIEFDLDDYKMCICEDCYRKGIQLLEDVHL